MKLALQKSLVRVDLVLVLACILACAQSRDHYCQTGYTLEIDLTARDHQNERLIPSLMPAERSGYSSKLLKCTWILNVPHLVAPRQLVIQGLSTGAPDFGSIEASDTCQLAPRDVESFRYEVSLPDDQKLCSNESDSTKPRSLRPGFFELLTLTDRRTKIMVSLIKVLSTDKCSRSIILRAVTPLPGFCSRDMLSFQGNCYTVSSVRQNVTDAMSSIRGDAQLASFSSMAEIRELIAANNARKLEYPHNKPLNLSLPLRLCMFYSSTVARVLAAFRSNVTGCYRLLAATEPGEFESVQPIAGSCISLTVGNQSVDPVIKFGNCSEPMLFLIRFPGAAAPVAATQDCRESNCKRDLLLAVEQLITIEMRPITDPVLRAPQLIMGGAVAAVLLAILVISIIFCRRKGYCKFADRQNENSELPQERLNLNTGPTA